MLKTLKLPANQPIRQDQRAWQAAAGARVHFIEAFVTLGVLLHLTSGLLHALGLF